MIRENVVLEGYMHIQNETLLVIISKNKKSFVVSSKGRVRKNSYTKAVCPWTLSGTVKSCEKDQVH